MRLSQEIFSDSTDPDIMWARPWGTSYLNIKSWAPSIIPSICWCLNRKWFFPPYQSFCFPSVCFLLHSSEFSKYLWAFQVYMGKWQLLLDFINDQMVSFFSQDGLRVPRILKRLKVPFWLWYCNHMVRS